MTCAVNSRMPLFTRLTGPQKFEAQWGRRGLKRLSTPDSDTSDKLSRMSKDVKSYVLQAEAKQLCQDISAGIFVTRVESVAAKLTTVYHQREQGQHGASCPPQF